MIIWINEAPKWGIMASITSYSKKVMILSSLNHLCISSLGGASHVSALSDTFEMPLVIPLNILCITSVTWRANSGYKAHSNH